MGHRRVTLASLAAELGVSPTTVSNAFSRPDQLSLVLRERVLAAAATAGYTGPDPLARGLARGRLGTVGLLLHESVDYAFADPAARVILRELTRRLGAGGAGLLLLPDAPTGRGSDPAAVDTAPVDVFVAYALPDDDPALQAALHRGLPVAVLDQPRRPDLPLLPGADSVGAQLAAQHLDDLGHHHVGVLSLPLHPDDREGLIAPPTAAAQENADDRVALREHQARFPLSADRLAGYRSGLPDADLLAWECPRNSRSAAARGTAALLQARPDITAILAATDELALGALEHLTATGQPVPGRISLIGYDDSPAAATAPVPLTTVRQPLHERGRQLAELTLALAARHPPPLAPPLKPDLIIRSSTSPPASQC